ncbi:MAG TPA: response regulator [Terriglobia bacterium]|nr:response regulator [Terriglobia bacterium]
MGKRILIIDDEDDIREIVEVALQQTPGWHTLTAGSAAEGLERARNELPDAILLDVMMPDIDGVTALARLRAGELTAAIPVILLTATVQVARGVQAGQAAGVILKPFDPLTLAQRVSAMLGWNPPSASPTPATETLLLDGVTTR